MNSKINDKRRIKRKLKSLSNDVLSARLTLLKCTDGIYPLDKTLSKKDEINLSIDTLRARGVFVVWEKV